MVRLGMARQGLAGKECPLSVLESQMSNPTVRRLRKEAKRIRDEETAAAAHAYRLWQAEQFIADLEFVQLPDGRQVKPEVVASKPSDES